MVMTVAGEVDVNSLGHIQPHEHIYLDGYAVSLSFDLILDDPETIREELRRFVEAGGKTIVEMTCHGLNPNPVGLRDVAAQVGMNIIASTGLYWERFHPSWVKDMSLRALADLFVGELNEGIAGTNVRAGIIGEIGSGHREVSAVEERVFRAVAIAQRETSAPIYTHAPFGWIGLQQAQILKNEGANMERVVIGHVDTVPHFEYQKQIAGSGAFIGFDTIGRKEFNSDGWRIDRLKKMIELGYEDRILLSSDVCRRTMLHVNGGCGYDHLLKVFLPQLSDSGVSSEVIRKLTHDNPARLWRQ
jgi:phosphotriesterase-related protein